MHIINDSDEFKDVPETLRGEVYLEATKDIDGNITGYMTASLKTVAALKGKSTKELKELGWDRYKKIIDEID